MRHPLPAFVVGLTAVAALALTGCTAEKARALRTAAVQFKVESLAAIDALDDMRRQELAPAPRSEAEATDQFVNDVAHLDPNVPLTPGVVATLIDPFAVTPDATAGQWNALLNRLRAQYAAFAAIFDDLERGSFLASAPVARAGKFAVELTAQMTAFATSVADHPPVLLQRRTAIVAKMEELRKGTALAGAPGRVRLAELKEQYQALTSAEQELGRATVERCLKAAVIGQGVTALIDSFDRLSIDDINGLVGDVLERAGQISGHDLGRLRLTSAKVVDQIKQDPDLSAVFNRASGELGQLVRPSR